VLPLDELYQTHHRDRIHEVDAYEVRAGLSLQQRVTHLSDGDAGRVRCYNALVRKGGQQPVEQIHFDLDVFGHCLYHNVRIRDFLAVKVTCE